MAANTGLARAGQPSGADIFCVESLEKAFLEPVQMAYASSRCACGGCADSDTFLASRRDGGCLLRQAVGSGVSVVVAGRGI